MAKTFSLGEIALIESITGYTIEDEDQPRGKYLAAQVLCLKKREVMKRRAAGEDVPDFTLEDAYNLDVDEAGELLKKAFGDADGPKSKKNT